MAAGKLRLRVQYERQGEGQSNGMGGTVAAWEVIGPAESFVEFKAEPGSELVLSGRLANREPAEIELRRSPFTITLSGADRMRELDGLGRLWNIKSVRDSRRRGYLVLTVETGTAGS